MTSIEWTNETWNPVTGCDRCSPGCDNCYALNLARRLKAMGQPHYQTDGNPDTSGPGFGVACHADALETPLRWKRGRMVFVNSMSDLFHPAVPVDFIVKVFAVMARTPQHTYQVLTKRPQRMQSILSRPEFIEMVDVRVWADCRVSVEWTTEEYPEIGQAGWLPNVWLGTSIESNRYVWREDRLRDTPAAVRFISAEPLLGELINLNLTGIDWLIAGGESGRAARPMHPMWARRLRDRCAETGTAFFFKQWGEWAVSAAGVRRGLAPDAEALIDGEWWLPGAFPDDGAGFFTHTIMHRRGKGHSGRELDGRTWDEYPKAVVAS